MTRRLRMASRVEEMAMKSCSCKKMARRREYGREARGGVRAQEENIVGATLVTAHVKGSIELIDTSFRLRILYYCSCRPTAVVVRHSAWAFYLPPSLSESPRLWQVVNYLSDQISKCPHIRLIWYPLLINYHRQVAHYPTKMPFTFSFEKLDMCVRAAIRYKWMGFKYHGACMDTCLLLLTSNVRERLFSKTKYAFTDRCRGIVSVRLEQ